LWVVEDRGPAKFSILHVSNFHSPSFFSSASTCRQERRKALRRGLPYDGAIDLRISINQDAAESRCISCIWELFGKLGIGFDQMSERLAEDLELALDSGAKHLIRQVLVETLAGKNRSIAFSLPAHRAPPWS